MNRGEKSIPLLFTFLLIAVTYLSIVVLVLIDRIKWFDEPIILFFRSIETPVITEIMKFFTFIGNKEIVTIIAIIIAIFMYLFLKFRREVVFFLLTLIGSTIINNLLKIIIQRDRPTEYRLIEATGYSFPSGHSMAAFTLYVTLTYLIWSRLKTTTEKRITFIIASIFIFLIGISRIYLGVHYPSDVIGGYFTSAIWVFFSILVYRKYKKI